MSRFSEEMKIIPRTARVLAVLAILLVPFFLVGYVVLTRLNYGREGHTGFVPLVALFGLLGMAALSIFILIVGYIAGDARRRGMRPVLWVLLAIFIPNAIGIILYFILREPLLKFCPKCGAGGNAAFAFCSVCGESLGKSCPSCRTAVQSDWSHCASCGVQLPVT
jgi:hypothetical protein